MDRQPFVLGFLLRKFPEFEFRMDNFDGRLRLQKFIYLLQAHDIYLGYDFSWYLRGPYCTTLAAAGFALDNFYDDIPQHTQKSKFTNNVIQKRFEKFVKFICGKETDEGFLEAAALLHFLLNTRQITANDAIKQVAKKIPNANESDVRKVFDMMRREELL